MTVDKGCGGSGSLGIGTGRRSSDSIRFEGPIADVREADSLEDVADAPGFAMEVRPFLDDL